MPKSGSFPANSTLLLRWLQWGQLKEVIMISLKKGILVSRIVVVPFYWHSRHMLSTTVAESGREYVLWSS